MPFNASTGRPSVDPELMIRMLLIGYCLGIRSERRLCDEVHLNFAYRWFCRLGLNGRVPDHSTFSKNRHGRFRDSDLLRRLFETVLTRCIAEGFVGGEGFAVEGAREMARDIARSDEGRISQRQRKKVEMLSAHLKRILKLDQLRLRGPNGARDESHLAAAAQNLRELAKLSPLPLPDPA